MDEHSKAALDLLVQNGYLEVVKGKYRPTVKLNEQKVEEKKLIAGHLFLDGVQGAATWEDLYIKFIRESGVPKKSENGQGDLYDTNKYNTEAMKVFRKMIERDGIKYDLLVKVAQAYYRSGGRYKKTITNYISEGIWRLDYLALKGQTTEQQKETLQKQVDESKPFTRDRIG